MSADPLKPSKRVLEPNERIAEILFGLIMVLTFTGSLSIADAGRDDVRAMLIGALGCNIAWGIIDGILYLMGCLADRGQNLKVLLAVRKSADPGKAQALLASALPPLIASLLQPAELASLHQRLQKLPEPPPRARLGKSDWLGAVGVFLLVFLTTFPVTIPFIFIPHLHTAMRLSNGVALAMLLITGVLYGRYVGRSPWVFGIGMMLLGSALVGLTIALGG
jgi:VIT family protein